MDGVQGREEERRKSIWEMTGRGNIMYHDENYNQYEKEKEGERERKRENEK